MINNKIVLTGISAVAGAALLLGAPAAEAHGFLGNLDIGAKVKAGISKAHILGNNDALIKGAKITAVSGSTLNATATLNGKAVNIIITTSAETKVKANGKEDSGVSNIKVGDTVMLKGTVSGWDSNQPTIQAKQILVANAGKAANEDRKDKKPFERVDKKAVLGSVVSVNSASSTLVVSNRNDVQTIVAVNASTTIKTGATTTGTFADIDANELVGIRGHIDAAGNFVADKIIVGWKGVVGFFGKHF